MICLYRNPDGSEFMWCFTDPLDISSKDLCTVPRCATGLRLILKFITCNQKNYRSIEINKSCNNINEIIMV